VGAVIYSLQPNEKALLSLYSLTGQAVLQKELVGNGKVEINLLQLPSGLYTYKAIGNLGSLYSGKLIIAK
jgi:hypothetical protein